MDKFNIALRQSNAIAATPNIQERFDMLSTEEFGVYLDKVSNFFTGSLSFFLKDLKVKEDELSRISESELSAYGKQLRRESKTVTNVINKSNMVNIGHVPVPVMLGMKMNLPSIAKLLEENLVHATPISRLLVETDKAIRNFIASTDLRKATYPAKLDSEVIKHLDALSDVPRTIVDPDNNIDRKKLVEVMPNINSILPTYESLLKISAYAKHTTLKEIKDSIQKITESTAVLVEMLESTDNTISKNRLHDIVHALENAGAYVTYVTSYVYLVNQTIDIFKNLIDIADKNTK